LDENRHYTEDDLRNPHVRHEPGDVNANFLAKFGVGMAFLIVVFLFGLWGLFAYLAKRAAEVEPARAVTWNQAGQKPPEPRLQSNPVEEYQQIRAEEERVMNHYAWVDPDKGTVRIPVDRAMDLIAQKGLPVLPKEPGKTQ